MQDASSKSAISTTRRAWYLIGAASVGFAWVAWNSTGFREADEVTHLGYAKWAHRDLRYIVDIWGRPIVTLLWAVGAQLGPFFARLTTVFVAAMAALAAVRLSRTIQRSANEDPADLAVACTLGLPLVAAEAPSLLTEIVFAALLGWACVFAREGKCRLAALLFGALPLARPEGFWIGPIIATWLLCAKSAGASAPFSASRWSVVALLAMPIAWWWWAGVAAYGDADWFITWWPRNWGATSLYGHGHPLLFAAFLVAVVTPWLWPFLVAGFGVAFKAHRRLELLLILTVTVLHGVLYAFGRMGSAGYPRYLVTLAPLLGCTCAWGMARFLSAVTPDAPKRAAVRLRAMLPWVIIFIPWLTPHLGVVSPATDQLWIDRALPVVKARLEATPHSWLIADHPWAASALGFDPNLDAHHVSGVALELAPTGSVAMIESKFALRYGRIPKEEVEQCLAKSGFERLPRESVVGNWTPPLDRDLGDAELRDFTGDVWVKVR